ncbi:MAG: hypothetical protein R6V02_07960 [Candidatus Aminicenantes bacterium]
MVNGEWGMVNDKWGMGDGEAPLPTPKGEAEKQKYHRGFPPLR